MGSLSIANWQIESRPREKMMSRGAEALSEAELLAILIGSGSSNENAVSLMKRILTDQGGSLRKLGTMDIHELCNYKGIGEAKAITILAACELGKRRAEEKGEERLKIKSSKDIYQFFYYKMRDLPTEETHIMMLNNSLQVIGSKCIGKGGITGAPIDIRTTLREAIISRATHIALCHNHPSGNSQPSRADDNVTDKLRAGAQILDIKLIDHIVLADGKYYSYADEGKL